MSFFAIDSLNKITSCCALPTTALLIGSCVKAYQGPSARVRAPAVIVASMALGILFGIYDTYLKASWRESSSNKQESVRCFKENLQYKMIPPTLIGAGVGLAAVTAVCAGKVIYDSRRSLLRPKLLFSGIMITVICIKHLVS